MLYFIFGLVIGGFLGTVTLLIFQSMKEGKK